MGMYVWCTVYVYDLIYVFPFKKKKMAQDFKEPMMLNGYVVHY